MAKLRSLLFVAGVPAVLIGLSTILPPSPGLGQSAGVDGFPVKVVNVNSRPLPTSAQGTTVVAGTVQAQQSATWSVALSGEAKVGLDPAANNVRINNTAANPAFVRSVDEGSRQPFQGEATVRMSDGAQGGTTRRDAGGSTPMRAARRPR